MKTAFIFPGQGSQSIGMGFNLYTSFSVAKQVFEEVDDALDQHLSALMFSGDEANLTQTQNAQPAIMAVSMAAFKVLESETGKKVQELASCVAGHSLGEYTALCAAGALDVAATAKLLRLRGLAMAEAGKTQRGTMAAVLGLEKEQVIAAIEQTSLNGETCVVANDNCPGQIVISGHEQAVAAVMDTCLSMGARRVVKLAVSGAFHSPLMQSAAEKMRQVLADTPLNNPLVPVIANVTARPVQSVAEIKDLLVRQVTGSVLWTDALRYMAGSGIERFAECGNGKVLAGLVKKTCADIPVVSIGTTADVEAYLK